MKKVIIVVVIIVVVIVLMRWSLRYGMAIGIASNTILKDDGSETKS